MELGRVLQCHSCPMLPLSLFPFTLISLNPGATLSLLITAEALNVMLSCEAVLTSSLLLSLLQRSQFSDLQTLPASLAARYISAFRYLVLVGMSTACQVIVLTL